MTAQINAINIDKTNMLLLYCAKSIVIIPIKAYRINKMTINGHNIIVFGKQ